MFRFSDPMVLHAKLVGVVKTYIFQSINIVLAPQRCLRHRFDRKLPSLEE